MKIYNTLSKRKERITKKKLKMFVCGPTVYNLIHIGNAKTYTQFDIIAKYLRYRKFKVNYIQNITDIDDKIIARAKELNKTPKEMAETYYKYYLEDIKNLGIDSVDKYIKATSHIEEIKSQISRLLKKGFAYKTSDGIYFDLKKDKEYGKLSGRTVLQAEDATSRIDISKEKRNKGDFCLWKFSKPGEPTWQAPFTKGRPGWHIEDTAITEKYFGPKYDIHGGGADLLFPHHEAEIAQMESISGKKPFVKIWMHSGFLDINEEKMAKSKGNFVTLRDVLNKFDKYAVRYFFATSHYKSRINYSELLLEKAKQGLDKIQHYYDNLEKLSKGKSRAAIKKKVDSFKKKFIKYMDDDFDTPKAFAALFDFMREMNKQKLTLDDGKIIKKLFDEINGIFGIIHETKIIPKDIMKLVNQREKARRDKNWKEADKLRDIVKNKGYQIDDTSEGPLVRKVIEFSQKVF